MNIEVYSDGSATTAEKAGGWASVIVIDGRMYKELSGHMPSATNNDAELAAAVQGLEYVWGCIVGEKIPILQAGDTITLISDSEIILNWANGKYKFKQAAKIQQYESLRSSVKAMNVQTKWVKGHNGDKWNERCDRLANLARKQIQEVPTDQIENKSQSSIGTKKTGVVSLWYNDILHVIDLEQRIVETYNRDAHGKRGSVIEIRENRDR